jgi:hypothetical protein
VRGVLSAVAAKCAPLIQRAIAAEKPAQITLISL